jgi:DNA gyrase inhibitor GyrI
VFSFISIIIFYDDPSVAEVQAYRYLFVIIINIIVVNRLTISGTTVVVISGAAGAYSYAFIQRTRHHPSPLNRNMCVCLRYELQHGNSRV